VIAQSIVNDHGGRIRVRSKRGEGTTLSVELPRNREKLVTADIGTASAGH
jgi:signal transduction histidine kinase